jgi:hypothetical protein
MEAFNNLHRQQVKNDNQSPDIHRFYDAFPTQIFKFHHLFVSSANRKGSSARLSVICTRNGMFYESSVSDIRSHFACL